MNKNCKRAIYKKTCLQNLYNKTQSRDNWNNYKRKKKEKKKKREREENKSLYKSKKERFEASFLKCLSGKNILKEQKFLKNY